MKFFNHLLNWIFPNKCVICSDEIPEHAIFCVKCFSNIRFIEQPLCNCCGKMVVALNTPEMLCESCIKYEKEFDKCRSLLVYNNESKRLIMKIKRQASFDIAKKCSKMISSRYSNIFKDADFIVPVPSHWTRILRRGYNPSAIIAKEFSDITKIPLKMNYLKRIKKTEYQKDKKIKERIKNVESAFLASDKVKDKTIILIDDVFTTGATLNECAKTLKLAGAKGVLAMTIASTC